MSARWNEELVAWGRERFGLALGVPLALLVGGAAWAGGGPASGWLRSGLLAWGLLLQFRLWDDVADHERDKVEHPERVLSRARSLVPFQVLLVACAAVNLVLLGLLRPVPAVLAGFLALNACFLGWYGGLRSRIRWRVGAALPLLLKYPAFVVLLGVPTQDSAAWRLPLAMAVVYLCFGAYELLHDERLRGSAFASPVLVGLLVGLWGTLAAWVPAVHPQGVLAMAVQGGLCLFTGALLVWLFRHWRAGRPVGKRAQALFVLCIVQLCGFGAWMDR